MITPRLIDLFEKLLTINGPQQQIITNETRAQLNELPAIYEEINAETVAHEILRAYNSRTKPRGAALKEDLLIVHFALGAPRIAMAFD